MKWWWKFGFILLSATILFISFVRAGLEKVRENKNFDKLRIVPVFFQVKNDFGELKNYCYNLPESNLLPGSPWYLVKKIRDELWINLTKNPVEKAEMSLLLADKKLGEAIKLDKMGKNNLANKTAKKAILKLEKTKKMVKELDQKSLEVIKINDKIDEATRAYGYLFTNQEFDKETNKLFIKKCYVE